TLLPVEGDRAGVPDVDLEESARRAGRRQPAEKPIEKLLAQPAPAKRGSDVERHDASQIRGVRMSDREPGELAGGFGDHAFRAGHREEASDVPLRVRDPGLEAEPIEARQTWEVFPGHAPKDQPGFVRR